MHTKLLSHLGERLSKQWASTLFTPAFIFWAIGFASAAHHFEWTWAELENRWLGYEQLTRYIVLFAAIVVIIASSFVVQWATPATLRWLEGYWPRWLGRLRHRLIQRQRRQLTHKEQQWQTLAVKRGDAGLSPEETEEFINLDWQLRRFPSSAERLMPTRLGNLLRAAEEQPLHKYGLDAVICWPRLWLVLPDSAKHDLQDARSDLNSATRIWLWSLLLLIWLIFRVWLIIPISIASALFAYQWVLSAAVPYADLLESAFDLYRGDLYRSLRWPLPKTPGEEWSLGQQLTQYLWRGSSQAQLTFED